MQTAGRRVVATTAAAVLALTGVACSDDDNDGNPEIEVPDVESPNLDTPDLDPGEGDELPGDSGTRHRATAARPTTCPVRGSDRAALPPREVVTLSGGAAPRGGGAAGPHVRRSPGRLASRQPSRVS